MCAIEGNYRTFYNLLSIYCSKNVSFRIILLANSQSRFCPWCTGSSRNSTPLMVSFPQICTLDWRTVPYRITKPGSGRVVYSYLGPTLAGFFGGKLGQWHPVSLHLFQVQKPHDAGHALEMFSEQTNPSQVVQLLLFLSRKSLSSAQVTGAEGQWPQLLGQRRATSNFSQAPRWLSWVQVKSSMLLSLMIRLVGYMSSHAGSNILVVAHSLQVTGQVDLTCFPTVSSSQKLCNCQQLKWLPKRQTPVFLWSSQRALHEQVSSALGFEFDKQIPGSNGFPSKSTHETCLFR